MELISVIIPAYNAEKTIERCLDSVLCQTYRQTEIIVVDDGSVDSTGSLLDDVAKTDARIIVIHQPNGGAANARLTGIRRAAGDYIAFVDADDTIDSTMLEYLLTLLHTQHCQVACCQYRLVNEDTAPPPAEKPDTCRVYDYAGAMQHLYEEKLWSLCCKLFQRELLQEERLLIQDLSVSEDLLMACSIYKQCSAIAVSDAKLYHYYRHCDSVMAQTLSPRHIRDSMQAYQLIAQNMEKDSPAYEYHIQNLLSNDFGFLNSIILKKVCEECYEELRAEILRYRRYAFLRRDNPALNSRHRLGVVLLRFCPPLFNIMIKIKG